MFPAAGCSPRPFSAPLVGVSTSFLSTPSQTGSWIPAASALSIFNKNFSTFRFALSLVLRSPSPFPRLQHHLSLSSAPPPALISLGIPLSHSYLLPPIRSTWPSSSALEDDDDACSSSSNNDEHDGSVGGVGGGSSNNNNRNNNGWWWLWWQWWNGRSPLDPDGRRSSNDRAVAILALLLLSLISAPALARIHSPNAIFGSAFVWEVIGGRRTMLVPDPSVDSFMVVREEGGLLDRKSHLHPGLESCWRMFNDLVRRLLLPEGYPDSVSSDYLEYSLWRGVQGIASQVSGILATQALLYAIGLGKGAIPTAAAVNWVLKDGIGYLSKIMLSKFGRHFDVNPKGWRLFADLLENIAFGLEILTPAFPSHFVLIGAAAGAGRSAAALIQASTRSCFYAGFASQRNFAEVIAKGEAQGMVSKFLGLMVGIALGNSVGSSTPLALAYFTAVTGIHMYCNFKSYQSIQLRTLNPYRASLVFSQYLLSGQVPLVKEVNDEEPFFPCFPVINTSTHSEESQMLSVDAKNAAAEIYHRVQLGSKLSEVINGKEDAVALFSLFVNEGYLLIEDNGRFRVILKEGSSPEDMLKSLFHVNYLYWLEKNVGIRSRSIADDCRPGGKLQISLDYAQREFIHVKHDAFESGWVTDGLVAKPLPNRIRPVISICPQSA